MSLNYIMLLIYVVCTMCKLLLHGNMVKFCIPLQLCHLNFSPIRHWFWKSKLPWHIIFNLWQTKEQSPCFFLAAVTSLTRLTYPLRRRFLTTPILLPSFSLSPTLSGALPPFLLFSLHSVIHHESDGRILHHSVVLFALAVLTVQETARKQYQELCYICRLEMALQ